MYLGINIKPAHMSITALSDADWPTDLEDKKDISKSCVYLGDNQVSWSSKKQGVVLRSSVEYEYRTSAQTTIETIWLSSLLKEI